MTQGCDLRKSGLKDKGEVNKGRLNYARMWSNENEYPLRWDHGMEYHIEGRM